MGCGCWKNCGNGQQEIADKVAKALKDVKFFDLQL